MAKATEGTKAPEVTKETIELQLEALRESLTKQFETQIGAVVMAARGEDVSGVTKEHPAWTVAFGDVLALRQKYEVVNRLNDDLTEKLKQFDHAPLRAERVSTEPGFIILPDGQRVNTRVIASYHPSGVAEIEFKGTDGKTLATYMTPMSNAQGSISSEKRRAIRDKVIQQLDELVDAMD